MFDKARSLALEVVRRWFYGCLVALPFAFGVLGYAVLTYSALNWAVAPLLGQGDLWVEHWFTRTAWIWGPLGLFAGGEVIARSRDDLLGQFEPNPRESSHL